MAKKYFKIDLKVACDCVLDNKKKKVIIDTYAAGVRFDPGATYTIEYEANFVKGTESNEFNSPAVANAGSFTTNSTGPQVQVDEPQDGGTNITNNTFIRYTYDRNILAGTGNFELYKVGSPDVLVATYNPSNSTISGNQITLDTTGLIDASETYYVLIDEGAVEDKDGLPAPGFNNDQEHRWTTAASTNVDFPDLISLQGSTATLVCEPTKNPNYEYGASLQAGAFTLTASFDILYFNVPSTYQFTGNTENQPFSTNPVYIFDDGNSGNRYTLQISINNGSLEDKLLSETLEYTNYTKAQVNTAIQDLSFYPIKDQSTSTTLGFTLINYATSSTLHTKNVTISYSGSDSTETWSVLGEWYSTNAGGVGNTYGTPNLTTNEQNSQTLYSKKYYYYSDNIRLLVVGPGTPGGTYGGSGGKITEQWYDDDSSYNNAYVDLPLDFRSQDYFEFQYGGLSGATTTKITKYTYSGGSYTSAVLHEAGYGSSYNTNTITVNGSIVAAGGGDGADKTYYDGTGTNSTINTGGDPGPGSGTYYGGIGGNGYSFNSFGELWGSGGRGYGRDQAGFQRDNKYKQSPGSGGYGGSSSESATAGQLGGIQMLFSKTS
jgi:hypothetical protein